MRQKALTLIILFLTINCYSQNITKENFESNFNSLLENLNTENWENAEKVCTNLLKYAEPIKSMETEKEVLRYIKIYSVAGLLNEKKITKTEALGKTEYLNGKKMIMPAHPFNSKCYVNCTHLNEDEENTFFTGVNNQNGTQIFSFEYVKIKGKIKETKEELEGKLIVLKGILNEISVEGNMLPRFKLKFINGEYNIQENK